VCRHYLFAPPTLTSVFTFDQCNFGLFGRLFGDDAVAARQLSLKTLHRIWLVPIMA
jgi:hypothetical protein